MVQIQVLKVTWICKNVRSWPPKATRSFLEAQRIRLSDDGEGNGEIEVLIGADNYWRIVTGQTRRLGQALVLTRSVFGWMIQGKEDAVEANCKAKEHIAALNIMANEEMYDEDLKEQVRRLWELEAIGIQENKEDILMTKEEEMVHKTFEKTVKFVNGHYEVRMPFKEDCSNLGNNYSQAEHRLRLLLKKLKRDPSLWARYKQGMQDYLNMGHAEEVDETKMPGSHLYYMPHHPVIKEERATTKCRIVFDASSHEEGKSSLNDCLFTGPNLNPDLPKMLIQFRVHAVALASDIEKAFLQVRIAEEDWDCVRLLWVTDDWKPGDPVRIKALRMTRVTFGVKSSTYHLAATIRHHAKKTKEEMRQASRIVNENTYVDDCLSGATNSRLAKQIYINLKTILGKARMTLKKWISNSKELMSYWEEQDESVGVDKKICARSAIISKILGMQWLHERDVFVFDARNLLQFLEGKRPTKKLILQASARMFDPLGLLSPIVIIPRCIFQRLWQNGIGWEEALPADLRGSWERWCNELPTIQEIEVPRWYTAGGAWNETTRCSMHVFCDASKYVYGGVVYLRMQQSDEQALVCLVASRCTVAPLKNLSVPRLELMGALIAARLGTYVKKTLQSVIPGEVYWTDSMIVMGWVKSRSNHWKTFVANRVGELQTITDPGDWRHCPGYDNPADLLSRGASAAKIRDSRIWWQGPEWLAKQEEEWPSVTDSLKEEEWQLAKEEQK